MNWKNFWGESPALRVTIVFMIGLMLMRILSNHALNNHYTGNYSDELALMTAAKNFDVLGYWDAKFMPIHNQLTDPSEHRNYYTHFPAMPYWLFSVLYNLVHQKEWLARMVATLISGVGIFFAYRAILRVLQLIKGGNALPSSTQVVLLLVLTLNPMFLCYGDTIFYWPIAKSLQWASLLWCIEYLFFNARVGWAIVIYFLEVWTSFEWLVPLALIFGFCVYTREGVPWRKPAPWLLLYGVGMLVPVCLRLVHNTWALGGLSQVIDDLGAVATLQAGMQTGNTFLEVNPRFEDVSYSLSRHVVKFILGVQWFVGFAGLALVALKFKQLRNSLKQNAHLYFLIVAWGIGSLSWQVLMPRHAMAHAFTYLPFSEFLIFLAALAVAVFGPFREPIVAVLVAGQLVIGGMIIQSEIAVPFYESILEHLAPKLCNEDRKRLLEGLKNSRNSAAVLAKVRLNQSTSDVACNATSSLSAKVIGLSAVVIKSRVGEAFEPNLLEDFSFTNGNEE